MNTQSRGKGRGMQLKYSFASKAETYGPRPQGQTTLAMELGRKKQMEARRSIFKKESTKVCTTLGSPAAGAQRSGVVQEIAVSMSSSGKKGQRVWGTRARVPARLRLELRPKNTIRLETLVTRKGNTKLKQRYKEKLCPPAHR
jgi:hypothetical protein